MSVTALRADDLDLDLGGRRVLHGVSLVANSGEPLAVVGPSGSGKTVLLLSLTGLLTPTGGTTSLDGSPIDAADTHTRSRFGVILQTQGLAPELTAEENVALPLQANGFDRLDVTSRSGHALAAVGLDAVADRLVGDLSGGQRQRVCVARALAGEPDVVIADEPTAELDAGNRSRVLSLLLDSPTDRIVIVASNDPEVTDACSSVVRLRDGCVVSQSEGHHLRP